MLVDLRIFNYDKVYCYLNDESGYSVKRKYSLGLLIALLFINLASAQSNTLIALQSEVTDLSTGEYYPVTVQLQDVADVWQINVEIEYDPNAIFVVGTVSGSPLKAGDIFAGKPAIVIRNSISAGNVTYTYSLTAPAEPYSGSGAVATFQIYPLSAGTTQIKFKTVELTKVNYTQNADGTRDVQSTEKLPVVPVLLELNITGETVPPPDEATPTPEPTPTLSNIGRDLGEATEDAMLVNVTLTPEPLTLIPELEEEGQGLPIVPIALGLVIVGLGGGILLLILSRRR